MAFFGLLSAVVLIAGLTMTGSSATGSSFASLLMCGLGLLSGLLCVDLGNKERNPRHQVLLLLLAFWLLWTGLQEIVQNAFMNWLSVHPDKSFYAAEFNHMMWTLTGLLASGYVFTDALLRRASVSLKWFVALTLVLAVWGVLWLPVLKDPELPYKQPLVRDFIVLDEYVTRHSHSSGKMPDPHQIARQVSLPKWEGLEPVGLLEGEYNLSRIEEVLEYLEGPEDYVMMVLRPLNERDGWVALMCVLFIGLALGARAVHDRPESAYIEKILLLLFLTWVFEAVHAFSFSLLRSVDIFRSVYDTGFLISSVLYLFLGFLISRRIDFVMSIEGQYYEQLLLRDAASVTRWIDRFDQFILNRFLGRRGPLKRLFTVKPR